MTRPVYTEQNTIHSPRLPMQYLLLWIWTVCLSTGSSACGPNLFEDENPNKVETELAAKHLEQNEAKKAIDVLLNYLGDGFKEAYLITNSSQITAAFSAAIAGSNKKDVRKAVSLLSQSVAQDHGLDPLLVILELATDSSSEEAEKSDNSADTSGTGANEITRLFPVLPAASDTNIAGFEKASAILGSLSGSMNAADVFKSALLVTSTVSLRMKKLDTDGDGKISLLETTNLTASDATGIISQIATAALAAHGASLGDGSSAQASEAIQEMLTKIESQEGSTDEEKLRNFLAKKGESTESVQDELSNTSTDDLSENLDTAGSDL